MISQAQHPTNAIIIDDTFLFLVMYSDGLAKVLKATCNYRTTNLLYTVKPLILRHGLNRITFFYDMS